VLKHFIYIWYGSGMPSKLVCSLNHDLTTSLGLSPIPIFLKSILTGHRRNSVRMHPYAHPQHIKVLKHFVYIWYGSGTHSKWVWSLNHDLTISLRLNHTSTFLKSNPTWHWTHVPIHSTSRW
jgi:hypothetical protein